MGHTVRVECSMEKIRVGAIFSQLSEQIIQLRLDARFLQNYSIEKSCHIQMLFTYPHIGQLVCRKTCMSVQMHTNICVLMQVVVECLLNQVILDLFLMFSHVSINDYLFLSWKHVFYILLHPPQKEWTQNGMKL